jgi:predicted DNA-binding antitoxin AbrB/MazE fold protein
MERVLEVVYQNGVFRPLEPPGLFDGQQMMITLHLPAEEKPDEVLAAWQRVYEGLSEVELAEVEAVALDRSQFLAEED